MPQPAVDLPDPLNGGNLAGVANADDLLSQLAGDEIDRLLAESDGDAAPRTPALSELFPTPTSPPPVPAVPVSAPVAPPAPPPTSPGLTDAMLGDSGQPKVAAPVTAALAGSAPVTQTPTEPSTLVDDGVAPISNPAPDRGPRPPRVGLLIKPLLWINTPFAGLSEPARELVGKLGLVTLFNAVAVFAYVWIFVRRHH